MRRCLRRVARSKQRPTARGAGTAARQRTGAWRVQDTMDRYSPRLLRGLAAAGVSVFLVAGAAFAANAVLGAPHGTSRDFVPAAASTPSGTSKAEATETAEPSEPPDSTTGTAEPSESPKSGEKAEGTKKAEASESPEPAETAEPS